jgi:hypothetical protein
VRPVRRQPVLARPPVQVAGQHPPGLDLPVGPVGRVQERVDVGLPGGRLPLGDAHLLRAVEGCSSPAFRSRNLPGNDARCGSSAEIPIHCSTRSVLGARCRGLSPSNTRRANCSTGWILYSAVHCRRTRPCAFLPRPGGFFTNRGMLACRRPSDDARCWRNSRASSRMFPAETTWIGMPYSASAARSRAQVLVHRLRLVQGVREHRAVEPREHPLRAHQVERGGLHPAPERQHPDRVVQPFPSVSVGHHVIASNARGLALHCRFSPFRTNPFFSQSEVLRATRCLSIPVSRASSAEVSPGCRRTAAATAAACRVPRPGGGDRVGRRPAGRRVGRAGRRGQAVEQRRGRRP